MINIYGEEKIIIIIIANEKKNRTLISGFVIFFFIKWKKQLNKHPQGKDRIFLYLH